MIFKLSIMFIFSILLSSDTPDAIEENRKYQLIPSIGDKELVFLDGKSVNSVSYTHLTLPTKRIV